MGISTLMSAAHAAGYAMGIPEELQDYDCEPVTEDVATAERASPADVKSTDLHPNRWASTLSANMRDWFLNLSGRAHA